MIEMRLFEKRGAYFSKVVEIVKLKQNSKIIFKKKNAK